MQRSRVIRSAGVTVALVAVIAACGNRGDDDAAGSAAVDAAAEIAKQPTAVAGADTAVAVANTVLGPVLVDGNGFTLYAFVNDAPNTSTCNDQCAASWPPLLVDGDFELGLSGVGFATATRRDGAIQLTVDRRPLYRFAGDGAPGDTNGQGSNGKWFVVDSSGRLIDGLTPAVDVAVGPTDLGDVLVDAGGSTLYAFLADAPNTSTCLDQCAASWPPLTIDGSLRAADDLTVAFSTITREDGTVQVTVAGRPLYRFANDQAPGDTNGQGVNGKWFAVDTAGNVIRAGA